MRLSQNGALAALNAMIALYNSGTLVIYSGTMPGAPETPVNYGGATNTLLATFTFAATAFRTPIIDYNGYYKTLATFTANPVTPTANGTACFARAVQGGSVIEDRALGQVWTAGMPAVLGQYVMANANCYVCMQAGIAASSGSGPSGTGTNIQDGTAYWMFWSVGSPDILITDAVLSTSTPLSIPAYWLAMPCN